MVIVIGTDKHDQSKSSKLILVLQSQDILFSFHTSRMLSGFCWFGSCFSFLLISESSVRSVGYAGHEGMVGQIKSAGHIRSVGSH